MSRIFGLSFLSIFLLVGSPFLIFTPFIPLPAFPAFFPILLYFISSLFSFSFSRKINAISLLWITYACTSILIPGLISFLFFPQEFVDVLLTLLPNLAPYLLFFVSIRNTATLIRTVKIDNIILLLCIGLLSTSIIYLFLISINLTGLVSIGSVRDMIFLSSKEINLSNYPITIATVPYHLFRFFGSTASSGPYFSLIFSFLFFLHSRISKIISSYLSYVLKLCILFAFLCALLSISRSAVVVISFTVFIHYRVSFDRLFKFLLVVFTILLAFALFNNSLFLDSLNLFVAKFSLSTLLANDRIELIVYGIGKVLDYPFPNGYMSYMNNPLISHPVYNHYHNTLLNIALDSSFIGIIAFLYAFTKTIIFLSSCLSKKLITTQNMRHQEIFSYGFIYATRNTLIASIPHLLLGGLFLTSQFMYLSFYILIIYSSILFSSNYFNLER